MSFHPFEKLGATGFLVGVILPNPIIGIILVIPAGLLLLHGQRLRHREILRALGKRDAK